MNNYLSDLWKDEKNIPETKILLFNDNLKKYNSDSIFIVSSDKYDILSFIDFKGNSYMVPKKYLIKIYYIWLIVHQKIS